MSDIFISYSRHDQDIVDQISNYLRQHNIDIWLDREKISAGEDWRDVINQSIDEAKACILILSVSSSNSPAVTREYRRILSQNKFLYIVKVDDIPIDEIHEPLRSHTYIDLQENFEAGMQELVTSIHASRLPQSPTLQADLSDDVDDEITLEVDLKEANTDKVVDVIKGLLDRGVKNIRLKNG